jgi:hypothetical protein
MRMSVKLLPITILVFLVQAVIATCTAAPVTLKCTAAGSSALFDIIIDIEKRTMTWGGSYQIRSITDRYITAILDPSETRDKLGGEVWVLDKDTGEYQRASVGMVSRGVNGTYTPFKLEANAYSGRCTRPLL